MDGILKLSYQYLSEISDNFSESNYIGHFQCGKLYHAKRYWHGRTLPYVLKMWEIPESYNYFPGDTKLRLMAVESVFSLIPKGNCSDKQDVFAYGVILLGLITKRVYTEEDRQTQVPYLHEWAHREYEARDSDGDTKTLGRSFVHESFKIDPDFHSVDGAEITSIAMECLSVCDNKQPTMKQVLRSLLKLSIVKQHADSLVVNKLLRPLENGH